MPTKRAATIKPAKRKGAQSSPAPVDDDRRVRWFTESICSFDVTVDLVDPEKFPEVTGNLAVFLQSPPRIMISWHLDEKQIRAIYLHEKVHAILSLHGLGYIVQGNDKRIGERKEETFVDSFASALFDDLERNGQLSLPPLPRLPR